MSTARCEANPPLPRTVVRALVLVAAFGLLACSSPDEPAPSTICPLGLGCACDSPFDCSVPETCIEGICREALPDPDAGSDSRDAGVEDDGVAGEDAADVRDTREVDEPQDEPDTATDPDVGEEQDLSEEPDTGEEPDLGPTCEDDRWDSGLRSNDVPSEATSVGLDDLNEMVLCPGNVDWLKLDLSAHHELTVAVDFGEGLDVALFDSTGTDPIGEPLSPAPPSGVGLVYQSSREVEILVRIREATPQIDAVDYSVRAVETEVPCIDDTFDDDDGDDERPLANLLTEEVTHLVFCDASREADWFTLLTPLGQDLRVEVDYDADVLGGELDLALYFDDESRAHVAVDGDGGRAAAEALGAAPGSWFIEVSDGSGGDPQGAYVLTVTTAPADDCLGFDLAHEPDGTHSDAQEPGLMLSFDGTGALVSHDLSTDLVMCEEDEADLFAVQMSAPDRMHIDLRQGHTEDDLVVRMYHSSADPASVAPLLGDDGRFFASYSTERAGVHFIRVEPGVGAVRTPYSLSVTKSVCDFDTFEFNDAPTTAHRFDAMDVEELGLTFCPTDDIVDWYQASATPNLNQALRLDNTGDNTIDISLFQAELVPMGDRCDSDLDCGAEVCLGDYGCVEPAIAQTRVDPGAFTTLEYPTGDGGEFLARVRLISNVSGSQYQLRWQTTEFICPADDFGSNHSEPTALFSGPLGNPSEGLLCNGHGEREDDYFEVDIGGGDEATIMVTFPPGNAVTLQVPCDSGATIDKTSSAGLITATLVNPGITADTHCFSLSGVPADAQAAVFDYSLTVVDTPTVASCEDDEWEPNDTTDAPSALNEGVPWVDDGAGPDGYLTLCGDADYFSLHGQPSDVVTVNSALIRGTSLTVSLFGPCNPGACQSLATAAAVGDGWMLTHTLEQEGEYLIGVSSTEDDVQYVLSTDLRGGCSADIFEPNDEPDLGADLDGVADLSICRHGDGTPDFDWFEYSLQPGDSIDVRADFARYHGDIHMALWKNGEVVASGEPATDAEELQYTAVLPGSHYLEVYSANRDNGYTLDVETEILPCPVDGFEPNATAEDAIAIQPGRYTNLNHCPQSQDWYRLPVAQAGTLSLELRSRPQFTGDDIIVAVYLDEDPLEAPLAVAVADRDLDVLSFDVQPGDHLIRVYQDPGVDIFGPIPYEMTTYLTVGDGCVDDRYEANDSGIDAARLGSNDQITGMLCGDDDWYVVHVLAGQTLSVDADFASSGPSLTLWGSDFSLLNAGDDSVSHTATTGDDVLLEVSADGTQGLYELSLMAGAAGASCGIAADVGEEDDSVAQARSLEGAESAILCDSADVYRVPAVFNDDLRIRVTYDPSVPGPTVSFTDFNGLSIGDGEPSGTGTIEGSLTWTSTGGPYVHLEPGPDTYRGPYLVEALMYGVCVPDSDEPNESFDDAVDIDLGTIEERGICHAGDLDFYTLSVPANRRAAAQAWSEEGDVGLLLFDSEGDLVHTSNGSSADRPKEAVWGFTGLEAEVFVVGVYSPDQIPTDYELRVFTSRDDNCIDAGTNHSFEDSAAIIGGFASDYRVCTGVDDWYHLLDGVTAGQTLRVRMVSEVIESDVDFEVYDASGRLVAAERTLDIIEEVRLPISVAGDYHVRVFVADGGPGVRYQLLMEAL